MGKKWLFESELALKAVSTSAEIIEEKSTGHMSFRIKGSPRDTVTDIDLIIEGHIKKILGASGHRIIGEETVTIDAFKGGFDKPSWFIDPVDGTTNLIASLPFYATSVGLAADSTFPVGAVAIPRLKEIFFTIGDQGAFMNGKALLKPPPANMEGSLIASAFSIDYGDMEKRRQEYEIFGILNDKSRGCLRTGSVAVNICYVAANRFQAAYGISNKIWDLAGALAIALQAGSRAYIEWNKASADVSYVVGSAGIAEEIVSLLRSKGIADMKAVEKSPSSRQGGTRDDFTGEKLRKSEG